MISDLISNLTGNIDFPVVDIPYLREALVFLGASLFVIPLSVRLRVTPILGYLVAGVVLGPFGMKLVDQTPGLEMLADLGVVFLLFMIGLKLSLDRLAAMRRYVFGLGILQVAVTGAVVALIAYAWGNAAQVSILLGFCFALSSTAVVSQILMEKNELLTHKGRVVISVLLAQDLMVVPLLVLVNVFAKGEGDLAPELAMAAGKAILAVALILVLGRIVLRPVLRMVKNAADTPELFACLTLFLVLLTSALTSFSGLSMELGAFLAGLLLAETEFRTRIEGDLKAFQGLLLGLFFMTVGMEINVAAVLDSFFWLVASVLGLCAIKTGILVVLSRMFKIENNVSLPSAVMLGQSGEFLFVVVGAAAAAHLMPDDVGHFMMLVAALSMIFTPVLSMLSDYIEKKTKTLNEKEVAS